MGFYERTRPTLEERNMSGNRQYSVSQPFTIASHKEPQSQETEACAEGKEYGEIGGKSLGDKKEDYDYCPEPEMAEHVGHSIKNDR